MFKKDSESPIDLSALNSPAEPKLVAPALSVDQIAYMNSAISEALKDLTSQLHAAQQANAFTPASLAEAFRLAELERRKPTEDEISKKKRQAREKAQMHAEAETNRANLQLVRDNCSHKYSNGSQAVAIIRNYHDRNPRGICLKCHEFFEPAHWMCGQRPRTPAVLTQ